MTHEPSVRRVARLRLRRFTRVHYDPSLGPMTTWSELSPTAAHSLSALTHSFELPSYIRERRRGFHKVSRRKVNGYADPAGREPPCLGIGQFLFVIGCYSSSFCLAKA